MERTFKRWQAWLLALVMMAIFTGPDTALAKRTNGGLIGGIVPTPALPGVPVPPGFDMTGYIQDATVAKVGDPMCPNVTDQRLMGGTVTINGIRIVVPCYTILQMPAFTVTWADLWTLAPKDIMPAGSTASGLALGDTFTPGALGLLSTPPTGSTTGYNAPLPAHELHVLGNVVNGIYIAGLVFISQQSLNGAQGVITCIDYPTGELQINGPALPSTYSTDGKCAAPTATTTRVRMNDPIGRFGWRHGGTGCLAAGTCDVEEPGYDPRYSADTDNATMSSALGFPICIPAFGPPGSANSDALCPMYNRPIADANGLCPSFPAASTLPAFTGTTPGTYCRTWVMDYPGAHALNPAKSDPTLSAPLVIGDTVTFMGTLKADAQGLYVSAHTISANLGIYTQPHSKPSYVGVEEVLVGTNGAAGVGGLAVEGTNKVSWVGWASDPTELVDMFALHQDPVTGEVTEYYLGTQDPCCTPLGRFRTPANNLGAFGDPQRMYRAISRNACQPDTTIANVDPNTGMVLDPSGSGALLSQLQTVCHMDPLSFVPTGGALSGGTVRVPNTATGMDNIRSVNGLLLNQNGLVPGTFSLPNFDFIFPENLNMGAPLISFNFQDLPFLFCGSGPIGGAGSGTTLVGQLTPAPWALPMPDPAFHNSLCPNAPAVGAVATTTTTTTTTPLPPLIVSVSATSTTGVVVGKPAIVTLTVNASNPNGTAAMTYAITPLPGITITPLSGTSSTGTFSATATFTPTAAGTINFAGLVSNGVGTGTGFSIPVTVVAATTAKAPTINSFNSALAGTNTGSFTTGQTVQMIAVATPAVSGNTLTFKFTQTAGQTPAVTLSAVQPAPLGYCRLPQICQMVTFTAPIVSARTSVTFNVAVTEVQTGLTATKTSGTVGINPLPADAIRITAAAWVADRTVSGTPINIGKFNVTAVSSATPAPIGMTMTAFLSNSTLPAGQPGSTTNPIPLQLLLQAADLPGTLTPVCGATPCWTGSTLGVIDNGAGDNIAPFTITVRSNLGGVASMLINDPLYSIKCKIGTFNPATGICK